MLSCCGSLGWEEPAGSQRGREMLDTEPGAVQWRAGHQLMKNDEEGDTTTSLHLTITSPGHRGSKSLIPLFLYLSPIRRRRGCRSKSLSDVAGWIAWPSAWPLLMKLMISVFLAFVLLLPLSISIRAQSWCLSVCSARTRTRSQGHGCWAANGFCPFTPNSQIPDQAAPAGCGPWPVAGQFHTLLIVLRNNTFQMQFFVQCIIRILASYHPLRPALLPGVCPVSCLASPHSITTWIIKLVPVFTSPEPPPAASCAIVLLSEQ